MVLSIFHVCFCLDINPSRSTIDNPFLWRRILYDSSEIQKSGENVESIKVLICMINVWADVM